MGIEDQAIDEKHPDDRKTPARRSHGIVVPHALSWPKRLMARSIYGLIRAVNGSLRHHLEIHPETKELKPPVIFTLWHNRLPLSLIMYRDYARQLQLPHKLAAIVSASKDGAVVARILELFQVQPVRGSTSRRGPQALLELTSWAEQGYDLAITPDGPRGPRYMVQAGAIALGQLTGLPVVPASNHLTWKICVKSWDRFQIPLPFSRAEFKFGQPLWIPRQASEEEREKLRLELERRMLELTAD